MMIRLLLIGAAITALVGLVVGFAITAERLGDWTDAHPQHAVFAWTLWNLGLLVAVGGLLVTWRRYRRSERGSRDGTAA